MKKGIILLAIFVVFMLSYKEGSLLPESHEINQLEFIRSVALDKGTGDDMRVTVLMKKEKESGGAGGGDESGAGGGGGESEIITGEGNTAFSTQKFFQSYSDKYLFYGHADYILIGEDAAREDIRKYMDFVTRDHEYRLTSHVYVTEGKAEDIITASKTFLPDKLRSLFRSVGEVSTSKELPIIELVSQLEDNETYGMLIPVIKLIETESLQKMEDKKQQSGEGKSGSGGSGQGPGAAVQKTKEVALGGFAVINNFKLVGYLDDYQARAYMAVTNKLKSGAIEVRDDTGNYVGLEILESGTQLIPRISDGRLTGVTVKTTLQTNVDEIHSGENIFRENRLKNIESEQSALLKKQIESLIQFAQNNKSDFLGIGQAVSRYHPVLWKDYENKWPDIFAGLNIDVQVDSKVSRSYDINEPIGEEEK